MQTSEQTKTPAKVSPCRFAAVDTQDSLGAAPTPNKRLIRRKTPCYILGPVLSHRRPCCRPCSPGSPSEIRASAGWLRRARGSGFGLRELRLRNGLRSRNSDTARRGSWFAVGLQAAYLSQVQIHSTTQVEATQYPNSDWWFRVSRMRWSGLVSLERM